MLAPCEHPHPQPFSPSARTQHPGSATNSVWGGTTLSRPTYRYPAPKGASHTPTSPHQRREHANKHASKQAEQGQGRRDNDCPTTPPKRQHQSTQTPTRTRAAAQTPNPSHPQANTPTTSLLFHHPREHKAPTRSAWAKQCERGNPWQRRATGTNEAQTTNAGTQDNAHNKRANNQVCVRCAPAPAREDSAREGRSQ